MHQLTPAARAALARYCRDRRLRNPGRADVILALFRTGYRDEARALLGVRPHLSRPPAYWASFRDQQAWCDQYVSTFPPPAHWGRRITYLHPNPSYNTARGGRSLTSDSFYRWGILRLNMTVRQALTRGVHLDDLRIWGRLGWLRLS